MRDTVLVAIAVVVAAAGCVSSAPESIVVEEARFSEVVALPPPDVDGPSSLEDALVRRRSRREFADDELPAPIIGQLLWAGQGITDDEGHRTAPSAGALYPLELYAVTATTLLHYLPDGHRVESRDDSTTLVALADVAFGQEFVSEAPAVLVISSIPTRTEAEYGARADELVEREAGHAAQNILLQAAALDLAATPVGGFDPADVARLLALPPGEVVTYLIPVGFPTADDG